MSIGQRVVVLTGLVMVLGAFILALAPITAEDVRRPVARTDPFEPSAYVELVHCGSVLRPSPDHHNPFCIFEKAGQRTLAGTVAITSVPFMLIGLLLFRGPGTRTNLGRYAAFGGLLVISAVMIAGMRPLEVRYLDDGEIPRRFGAPTYLNHRANCGSLFWPSNTGFDPCRFVRGTEAFFVAGIGGAGLAAVAGASFLLRRRPSPSGPAL